MIPARVGLNKNFKPTEFLGRLKHGQETTLRTTRLAGCPISSLKSAFEIRRIYSTPHLKHGFCLELGQCRNH